MVKLMVGGDDSDLIDLGYDTAIQPSLWPKVMEKLADLVGSRFGVSPHILQVQLAHVFEKTGASRQSDLIRLVMRLASVDSGGAWRPPRSAAH